MQPVTQERHEVATLSQLSASLAATTTVYQLRERKWCDVASLRGCREMARTVLAPRQLTHAKWNRNLTGASTLQTQWISTKLGQVGDKIFFYHSANF